MPQNKNSNKKKLVSIGIPTYNRGEDLEICIKNILNQTYDNIEIIVHPQSIIHSMVEFIDGSIKAQLGTPNMKIPIQYALTYPKHFKSDWEELNLAKIGSLTFEKPNTKKSSQKAQNNAPVTCNCIGGCFQLSLKR